MAKNKKLYRLVLILLVILTSYLAVFYIGKSKGYDQGYIAGTTTSPEAKAAAEKRQLIDSTADPFRSVSGTVTEITDEAITVRSVQGPTAKTGITSGTKVSKKKETKSLKDIKTGMTVAVFMQKDSNDEYAARIVILDQ